jgi:regulator of protease activity HflC (stomatin/prohibitin superfamily)
MKEPIRTYGRDEVQKFKGTEVKERIDEIGAKVLERSRKRAAGTPYEILDVVVGNIQYPSVVSDAVAMKLKADQDLARMSIEVEIEKKKATRRIVEAEGIAKAMEIVQQKLTPLYLQHEAIEAQKMMVGSTNHTTVYIPVGNMGVPLVGTFDVVPLKREEKK